MCCDTIICSSTTTTGTGVILIPNRTIKNLTNLSDYRLVLACNISAPTSNLPVFIQTKNRKYSSTMQIWKYIICKSIK